MTEPFLGEIQAFAFGYAPRNWAVCDGSILPIQGNSALFSLIGTYYGGNGTTNFALPNLTGSVTMSQGQGPLGAYVIGEQIGQAEVTLQVAELPAHTHTLQVGNRASPNSTSEPSPTAALIDPAFNGFVAPPTTISLAPSAVAVAGSNLPHPNAQPTLAMVYCICTSGIFPPFQ